MFFSVSFSECFLAVLAEIALGAEMAVEGLASDAEFFAEGVDLGGGIFEGGSS